MVRDRVRFFVRVSVQVMVRVKVSVRVWVRVRICVRGLKLKGSKFTYSNQKTSEIVQYCSFSSLPARAGSG